MTLIFDKILLEINSRYDSNLNYQSNLHTLMISTLLDTRFKDGYFEDSIQMLEPKEILGKYAFAYY